MNLSRKKPRIEVNKQDYVIFGTSIVTNEGVEEGKYEPIWKQEVRDERGRRRLHGAFTGGFSAGYFNTVGSKEGWTPQSFRSSRKERAKLRAGRIEDYMDSEDLAEMEEERRIKTKDDYIGIGGENSSQMIKGSILDDLIIKKESIGVRLLKKMGWKEGQGVGPLIKKSKVEGDDGEVEDEYALKFLFAPKNSIIDFLKNKTDLYGLGYIPSPAIERLQNITNNSAPKFGISGISFGYGVLNEDDNEYDHDVYDSGPSSIKYDTVLDHEEKKKSTLTNTKLKPITKHLFVPRKKTTSDTEVKCCQDGTLPLNGFVVAEIYRMEKKTWFDPPVVPSDYVPSAPHSEKRKITKGVLQPRDRGAMLDNEEKRKRYILFLQEHAGIVQRGSYENTVSPHDYEKEADEFAKSARIFKPMSGIMKNRFITSSSFSPVSVVDHSSEGGIVNPSENQVNTAEEAAKMNMFGSLTRIITPFYPAKLLCKRFNVRDLYSDKSITSDANNKPKNELVDKSIVEGIMREVKKDQSYVLPEKKQENLKIDDTTNEALEKERPSMNIFISIFGDDENDENDDLS
ncbi:hypothetical protein PCK1_002523 [Pneumocystis canis]|nr:hypothetical protein PCK1_002523 [Pneumocystis canis]